MIASLSLLGLAAVLLIVGPRLATASWTQQAPRLAVLTWQALTVSVVAALVLAGVTLLIPTTALASDLGAIVHACAMSIASAYGAPQSLPTALLGTVVVGVIPAWIAVCAIRVLVGGSRSRRQMSRSLDQVTEHDGERGLMVLDAAEPAAFCVPGRRRQIVVTRGALDRLSDSELAGVLAHERAHLHGRHDLAVALAQVLARAFPGVRLFQAANVETRRLVELLADDVAVRAVDRVSVASAIVSLAEMRAPAAAFAMAQDAAVLRVNRLLQPRPPMTVWRHRLGGFTVLAIVTVPVLLALYPTISAALSDLCNIP